MSFRGRDAKGFLCGIVHIHRIKSFREGFSAPREAGLVEMTTFGFRHYEMPRRILRDAPFTIER